MRNLTLRQIKIFISAAKHLSFSRAAEELHITGSAISLQIKEMEADIGLSLFNRENRKVILTTAGETFLTYANEIINTLSNASKAMDSLFGAQLSVLKIGLVSTTRYFLTALLVQFKKDYPNVQIKIDVKNRVQLIELLREGEIDIAIMGKPPTALNARSEAFSNHPHMFIASPKHALAYKPKLAPEILNKVEIISREQGSGTRYIMEKYLTAHKLSPLVRMEMSGNETIKQSVMANLGVSFVSLHTVNQEIASHQIVVLDIQDTPVIRVWHLVTPNKREASAAEAFREFMLEKAGDILHNLFVAHNKVS